MEVIAFGEWPEIAFATSECATRSGDGDQSSRDQRAVCDRGRERRGHGCAGGCAARSTVDRQFREDRRAGGGTEGSGERRVVVGRVANIGEVDAAFRAASTSSVHMKSVALDQRSPPET